MEEYIHLIHSIRFRKCALQGKDHVVEVTTEDFSVTKLTKEVKKASVATSSNGSEYFNRGYNGYIS